MADNEQIYYFKISLFQFYNFRFFFFLLFCLHNFILSLIPTAVNLGNFHFNILTDLFRFIITPLQVLAYFLCSGDWSAYFLGLLFTDRDHMVTIAMGISFRLSRPLASPNWCLADLYFLTVSLLIACDLGVGLGLSLTNFLRFKSAEFLGG